MYVRVVRASSLQKPVTKHVYFFTSVSPLSFIEFFVNSAIIQHVVFFKLNKLDEGAQAATNTNQLSPKIRKGLVRMESCIVVINTH